MWSEKTANAGNTFDHNTVQTPTLANGIAIYGGTDNTVSNNLVADPIREGSGIHVGSRFGAEPFAGHLAITNNTTVRAGTYELNWNIGLGAIWIYALDQSIDADIQVTGDHYLDNTYNAIMLVSELGGEGPVLDHRTSTSRTSGSTARAPRWSAPGSRARRLVRERRRPQRRRGRRQQLRLVPLHPAGSEFALTDLGGNDGGENNPWHPGRWLAPWELPNTITCDDRPPVVAPPAPSPWVQPVG